MVEIVPLFDIVDLTIKFLIMCGGLVIVIGMIFWFCHKG